MKEDNNQSPYSKYKRERHKVTSSIPIADESNKSHSVVEQKFNKDGIFIQTIGRGKKRNRTIDDDDFFYSMFGGGATIVSQDSYHYENGQFHHD